MEIRLCLYPSKCFWGYPTNFERNIIVVTDSCCTKAARSEIGQRHNIFTYFSYFLYILSEDTCIQCGKSASRSNSQGNNYFFCVHEMEAWPFILFSWLHFGQSFTLKISFVRTLWQTIGQRHRTWKVRERSTRRRSTFILLICLFRFWHYAIICNVGRSHSPSQQLLVQCAGGTRPCSAWPGSLKNTDRSELISDFSIFKAGSI